MKILCDSSNCTLSGTVADDADLDSRFKLICDDTGETLYVNGWLFNIEVIE